MSTSLAKGPVTEAGLEALERRIEELERKAAVSPDTNAMTLLVLSGERDKLMAAFVMATGAAACGMQVRMFFTFWATAALRRSASGKGKRWTERAFGWLLPACLQQTRLSHLDMFGLGRRLMDKEMKRKGVADLDSLVATAAELGVTIQICEMSMRLIGICQEELIDYPGLNICGIAQFVENVATDNTTLFI